MTAAVRIHLIRTETIGGNIKTYCGKEGRKEWKDGREYTNGNNVFDAVGELSDDVTCKTCMRVYTEL